MIDLHAETPFRRYNPDETPFRRYNPDQTAPFLLEFAVVDPDADLLPLAARPARSTRRGPLRWRGVEVSSEFERYAARVARGEDLAPFRGEVLARPHDEFPLNPQTAATARPRRQRSPRRGGWLFALGLLAGSVSAVLVVGWTAPEGVRYAPRVAEALSTASGVEAGEVDAAEAVEQTASASALDEPGTVSLAVESLELLPEAKLPPPAPPARLQQAAAQQATAQQATAQRATPPPAGALARVPAPTPSVDAVSAHETTRDDSVEPSSAAPITEQPSSAAPAVDSVGEAVPPKRPSMFQQDAPF